MTIRYCNADTGSDTTGDGSSGNPYQTISQADYVSANGDTIYLQDSVAPYADGLFWAHSLTVIGESVAGVNVIPSGGTWMAFNGLSTTLQNLTWTFDGNCLRLNYVDSYEITFDHCLITGAPHATYGGFWGPCSGSGNNVTFTIKNCLIKGIANAVFYGIFCFDGTVATTTWNIFNNTFYSDGSIDGIKVFRPSGGAGNIVNARNNIFFNKVGGYIFEINSGGSVTMNYDHNCAYNMSNVPTGTDNLTSDPCFVDPDADNFELDKAISPCANTAVIV